MVVPGLELMSLDDKHRLSLHYAFSWFSCSLSGGFDVRGLVQMMEGLGRWSWEVLHIFRLLRCEGKRGQGCSAKWLNSFPALISPSISEDEYRRGQGPDEAADIRMQQTFAHRALQDHDGGSPGVPELEPKGAWGSGTSPAGVSSHWSSVG